MTEMSNLVVLNHPLVRHKQALLRQVDTPTKLFRELSEELAMLLAYEATRDLDTEQTEVITPLETYRGDAIAGKKLTVVPILRAGLGMVPGVQRLIPGVRIGHIGMYRDEESLQPVEYYSNTPAMAEERLFLVVDPMLATGGSAVAAIDLLKARGAVRIKLLCLVSAPEGVARMGEAHPDVMVYTAALDRQLNEKGYILPGLGDAGDRMFGTR